PPRVIRRLVLAPLVIVIACGFIVLSPFLALMALVAGLLARSRAGHMRSLRLVGFVLVWFVAETVALVVLAGLWVVIAFAGPHPSPPLGGHAPAPGHAVRGGRTGLRAAGRGGRARPHRRGAGRAADQAGHRAQQARRAG